MSASRSTSLGVGLTAFSWSLWSFALFRFITGAGIGGEYSAVNSAIDELIPARFRGRVDLMINGSFWLGAAAGAISTVILLNPKLLPVNLGWRLGFGAGAIIGTVILYMRRFIPESPRWLVTHGQREEAEKTVAAFGANGGARDRRAPGGSAARGGACGFMCGISTAWRRC